MLYPTKLLQSGDGLVHNLKGLKIKLQSCDSENLEHGEKYDPTVIIVIIIIIIIIKIFNMNEVKVMCSILGYLKNCYKYDAGPNDSHVEKQPST